MTRNEFKLDYKRFDNEIGILPMIGEVYDKFPQLTKFVVYLEWKLGIVGKPQLFRLISSIHYEYTEIIKNGKTLAMQEARELTFQIGHQRIISNILAQIYNSMILIPVMGERNDDIYAELSELGYATKDYFNVYFSMVKASLNYQTQENWNRLDKYIQLLISSIATFDDDFNIDEFVKGFLEEVDKQPNVNNDVAQNIIFLIKFNEYVKQLTI